MHLTSASSALRSKGDIALKLRRTARTWIVSVLWTGSLLASEGPSESTSYRFDEADFAWWAIQPVKEPTVPRVENQAWARNPIDRFVLRKLEEAGLEPASGASSREIVRRVYFDLHGLPPTPSETAAFLSDFAVDPEAAYDRLIERLLASPRYGERWAQHWLDVVRYAETDGYRADDYRPDAWRYRDYVIRSLNEDKSYDRFIREQLAGDEIDRNDPDVIIGTAFLRHGVYEWNQRNARMQRELIVNEMTNVTGEVFLGLSVGCAQCHNHKFDPILQKDYYALQSFLSTTYWPTDWLLATPQEQGRHEAALKDWTTRSKTLLESINGLTAHIVAENRAYAVGQFPPDIQEMYYKPDEERSPYEAQMADLVHLQVVAQREKLNYQKEFGDDTEGFRRYQELACQLEGLERDKPDEPPKAFASTDLTSEPVPTYMETRNGPVEVEPAFLELLGLPPPAIAPKESTTGRRSALAEWIADPDNPLSTRVMVNRLWHYHFGTGIVPTPNDFGNLGGKPSHPELLDWLTARFIENGWRLKPLHRLILQSAAYRQTARKEPDGRAREFDPENRLLWRFSPRRLSGEETRDAMLATSGELEMREGGPSLKPDSLARSIYIQKRRNKPEAFLHSFDSPQGFDSAPQRLQTTTPLQSLLLTNGKWTLQRAVAFSRGLVDGCSTLEQPHITKAYEIAYSRPPSDEELRLATEFIERQRDYIEGSETQVPDQTLDLDQDPRWGPLVDLCHVLITSNEFLYIH